MNRTWAVIFIAVGLIAMLLLAGSIPGLKLAEGKPFPFNFNFLTPLQSPAGTLPGGDFFLLLIRIIFACAWVMLPIMVVYLIINPKARKQFLLMLLRILPFILILVIVGPRLAELFPRLGEKLGAGQAGMPGGLPYPAPPAPEFNPNPPEWLVIIGSVGVTIMVVTLLSTIGLTIWRNRHTKTSAFRRLADEAQEALDSLQTGGDLKDTVLRCYYEMVKTVKEQKGYVRSADMTPIEFEAHLVRLGLPPQSVHDLTAVFQDVRYGNHTPGEREERQAILSLTAIIDACRGTP